MAFTCPSCGKVDPPEDRCGRCGAELAHLRAVLRAADSALAAAAQRLKQGDWPAALDRAETSWRLRRSPLAARIAFLACIGSGRFPSADRWYPLAEQAASPKPISRT